MGTEVSAKGWTSSRDPRSQGQGLWGAAGAKPSAAPAQAPEASPAPSSRPSPGARGGPPRARQQQLQPGQRALRLARRWVTTSGAQGGQGEHLGRGSWPFPPPPHRHQGGQGANLPPTAATLRLQLKSLEKAGVLNRTKTVDRGKRLR